MSTESHQQIAREARDKIRSHFGKPLYANDEQDGVLSIILSAIERANEFATLEEAQIEAAQPQHREHLKECSAVSTKPVKTERQPIIRSIEDSLISTPQRSELTDEQIRACICTIGDKINPKCPTHNPQRSEQQFVPPPTGAQLAWQDTVSEQQEWTVLIRQAKAYAQCNCPDAPSYHSNCQRKLLPILEQIDAAFTAERQQERKSNAPRSLEANCGQLP